MAGRHKRVRASVTDRVPPGVEAGPPPVDATPADGRVARRERNINAVLDVVLEMFAEESLFPTMEQAAARSGLSLRSLYRYFADPGELLEATIRRNRERTVPLTRLHAIGTGPLDARIDDFVTMRLRLYDAVAPEYRATRAHAHRLPRISEQLATARDEMCQQFKLQFAPELEARTPESASDAPEQESHSPVPASDAPELGSGGATNLMPADSDAVLAAGDLLTQLDSIDYLRRHRGLSAAETKAVLTSTLNTLLA